MMLSIIWAVSDVAGAEGGGRVHTWLFSPHFWLMVVESTCKISN